MPPLHPKSEHPTCIMFHRSHQCFSPYPLYLEHVPTIIHCLSGKCTFLPDCPIILFLTICHYPILTLNLHVTLLFIHLFPSLSSPLILRICAYVNFSSVHHFEAGNWYIVSKLHLLRASNIDSSRVAS